MCVSVCVCVCVCTSCTPPHSTPTPHYTPYHTTHLHPSHLPLHTHTPQVESSPHYYFSFCLIGDFLFSRCHDDFCAHLDQLPLYRRLLEEPRPFWLQLLASHFTHPHHVTVSSPHSLFTHTHIHTHSHLSHVTLRPHIPVHVSIVPIYSVHVKLPPCIVPAYTHTMCHRL